MQAQGASSTVFGGFKCMILYVPGEFASFLSCWKRGTGGMSWDVLYKVPTEPKIISETELS